MRLDDKGGARIERLEIDTVEGLYSLSGYEGDPLHHVTVRCRLWSCFRDVATDGELP